VLFRSAKVGVDVIIHQGKNLPELGLTKDAAHQRFADNVRKVLNVTAEAGLSNCIILENSARQGTECGYSLADLYDIDQRINKSGIKGSVESRVKYCIDLCHIFVAGELDVRRAGDVQDWFQRFDQLIGLPRLAVIHFNDSDTDFDGANDNHGSVGRGYIGRVSTEGFQYVCRLASQRGIPLILETSPEFMKQEITLLTKWSSTGASSSAVKTVA